MRIKKRELSDKNIKKSPCVLEGGLEPPQPRWPKDFKSFVSTIPPFEPALIRRERKTGLEPATLTLARLCSTN